MEDDAGAAAAAAAAVVVAELPTLPSLLAGTAGGAVVDAAVVVAGVVVAAAAGAVAGWSANCHAGIPFDKEGGGLLAAGGAAATPVAAVAGVLSNGTPMALISSRTLATSNSCASAASTLWFAPARISKRHRERRTRDTSSAEEVVCFQVSTIFSGVMRGRGMNSLRCDGGRRGQRRSKLG